MNLFQIEYFMEVAKYLNFTTAAKNLFISQPALSKGISRLEDELQVKLIERTTHSVRLTTAGAVLFKEFDAIGKQINLAIDKVYQAAQGQSGSISIGCLSSINIDSFLPQMLEKFSASHPEVKITLERLSFKTLREKLQNHNLDVIFSLSFEMEEIYGIHQKEVCKRKECIVLSSAHPISTEMKSDLLSLQNEPLLLISKDETKGFQKILTDLAEFLGFMPQIERIVPNMDTLFSYLDLGMGWAILDRSIEYNNNKYKFEFIDFPDNKGIFNICCAWKTDNLNPVIPYLLDAIPEPFDSARSS